MRKSMIVRSVKIDVTQSRYWIDRKPFEFLHPPQVCAANSSTPPTARSTRRSCTAGNVTVGSTDPRATALVAVLDASVWTLESTWRKFLFSFFFWFAWCLNSGSLLKRLRSSENVQFKLIARKYRSTTAHPPYTLY